MRKKTKQSVDVANVKDAWSAFFNSNKIESEESLLKDGWRDIYDVAKMAGKSVCSISRSKNLDIKLFPINRNGRVSRVRFCRPK